MSFVSGSTKRLSASCAPFGYENTSFAPEIEVVTGDCVALTAGSGTRYTATVERLAPLSPMSPMYKYWVPATGPGPVEISSQSVALAPEMLYVPRFVPAGVIAKIRAESPESLCVHRTFEFIRLATIPDAS